MKAWETLICGTHIVGEFLIEGCDNYHIYGRFRSGPDFSVYENLLHRVFRLQQDEENDLEVAEDWLDVLEEVNAWPLQLRDPRTGEVSSIKDFQLHEFEGIHTQEGVRGCFHYCL